MEITEVLLNSDYGGFNLSELAISEYKKIKSENNNNILYDFNLKTIQHILFNYYLNKPNYHS